MFLLGLVFSLFYFPDRESIVTEQKIDFEILTDLCVLRSQEAEKVDLKNVRLSVCLSVYLSILCGGHSEDTIVTINLKFGMWTQNVNISSRFFDIFFILIIKGSLPYMLTALTLKRSKIVSFCSLIFCNDFFISISV